MVSEDAGVLVASQGTRGIGVYVVSVGGWGVEGQKAAAVRGERMEGEGELGSAPPMITLCSAHHLPRGV